ncbi:NLR family CARD domain-containing protein 3-like isoform X1 [Astyanax mexicanus]|uniref:NLR family CARD domain-containing protein 3-like isoform X1 n=2 Tax=Astyanax mexicanus TaxID=7994 RepID=UPI0020CAEF9E|nr:NLR family CARD domain-containing protein 3-like isoform X1 [Astyanax mexicanus]
MLIFLSQTHEERPDSLLEPSCISLKTNHSMEIGVFFKDREASSAPSQIQAERPDSLEPSCISLKTNRSMEIGVFFKDREPSSAPSILHKALERVNMMKLPRTLRTCPTDREPQPGPATAEDFKSTLKKTCQWLNDLITKHGTRTLLTNVYTELYISVGEGKEINSEHEVRQMEAASRVSTEETPIKCNDLFTPLSEQDKPIRTVLTKGDAGIGKTVSVQKFILDWAEGKANQDLHFIFPLPFRELNLMKDQKLSLMDLLHECFKETKEMEISSSHKALFIFDGLDESRLALDFQNGVNLCDVTESAPVEVLLMNLMKGNLLPSALIWITSRPAAADQIPSECVDRVTEVRGFSDPQKEEYFRKRISDQSLADRTIKHLKTSRSLYIMCQIPVFCWISATVLEKILNEAQNRETPKTLTEMYTHFIIIQTQIIREKYQKNQQHTDEEMLLKLGQLAFQQLMKGNLVFYDEDLRECGIDIIVALVYSGVCTQIFREESELLHSKVFCFVHLSIQEHLAALYVHLTFMNRKKNVLKQKLSSKLRILKRTEDTLSDIHKSAIDQFLYGENEHLDLFVRFLMGLSVESNQTLLQDIVTRTESSPESNDKTVQYIKKKIRENPSAEKSINLFHCLNELEHHSLVEEIQHYLQSGDLQTRKLSPSQWSAVIFVLRTSSQEIDVFDLSKYTKYFTPDDVLLHLLPVVATSRKAQLYNCFLKEKSWTALASVLSSEFNSLRELDLTGSYLQHPADKLLFAGLENPLCKLETLTLWYCWISPGGCAALALALKSNPSHLRKLDLTKNKIGNTGVKLLSVGLENPLCKLETLKLWDCKITEEGCAALASALKSNPSHLRKLDLTANKIGDSGVKLLSTVLMNPLCKLEKLRLKDCKITGEGCDSLVSALNSNPLSLRVLNLSGNKVGDTGVKLLLALKADEKYRLQEVWV